MVSLTQAFTLVPSNPAGPNATGGFTFSPTSSNIVIQFNAPPGTVAGTTVNYAGQYKRATDFTWTDMNLGPSNANPTAFFSPTLAANTSYMFRVTANGSRTGMWFTGTTLPVNPTSESPDGTFLVNALVQFSGNVITDSAGNQWTLNETSTPYQVVVNGTIDNTAFGDVICLMYVGRRVYIQSKDHLFWSKSIPSDTWLPTTDPRVGAPVLKPAPSAFTVTAQAANTVMAYQHGPILDACSVTLIFWGSAWNTQTPSASTIANLVSAHFASPYWTGLSEYYVNTPPVLAGAFIYTNTQPPNFANLTPAGGDTAFNALLTSLFDSGTIAPPIADNQLYMIMLPISAGNIPGVGGSHYFFQYRGNNVTRAHVFGFNASNVLDLYTSDIAHECVEALTDPWPNSGMGGWSGPGPASTPTVISGEELEDFDNTGIFQAGAFVFGFYSNRARQVIIPTQV